jgi:hypothetical protein
MEVERPRAAVTVDRHQHVRVGGAGLHDLVAEVCGEQLDRVIARRTSTTIALVPSHART